MTLDGPSGFPGGPSSVSTHGWYPDPSGYWEYRWWDGSSWSADVATGLYQHAEPLPTIAPTPGDPRAAIFDVSGTYEREPARFVLSWYHVTFVPTRRVHETRHLPLGMVAAAKVANASSADAAGTVRLEIRGAGYVGPGVIELKGVPGAHWVRALILRQRAIVTGIPATVG